MTLTFNPANIRIGIIGLRYVCLPLAVEIMGNTQVCGGAVACPTSVESKVLPFCWTTRQC
mgnify:CR=1 FL=1